MNEPPAVSWFATSTHWPIAVINGALFSTFAEEDAGADDLLADAIDDASFGF